MLRLTSIAVLSVGLLVFTGACDDAGETETDATGGAGPATSSSNTGGAGQGGGMASGGSNATTGGSGGTGGTGGADACSEVVVGDGTSAETCTMLPTGSMPATNTTICPADSGVFWPAVVYEVQVAAGDCLSMAADNVGSPLGADLFGATVDPNGESLLWDEEQLCTVANPEGFVCPAGGAVMQQGGTAYVMVGSWEGEGCAAGETTPFTLSVAVNGVDVDLSNAFVCAGDLREIVP